MRKDAFKNKSQSNMTAWDLDCHQLYKPSWRGKAKRLFRRIARRKLKREIEEEE